MRIGSCCWLNAALLTHADGTQSESEQALLDRLIALLDFRQEDAAEILSSVEARASLVSNRALK